MPSQGNPTRIKTALDTEVCEKVIELERDFYRYVDVALPKKHKYTLVAACVNGLLTVRRLIVKGMDYDINYYARDKHCILTDARAELRNVAVDIQHLNDLGDVSNEAKAHFDVMLDGIFIHIGKLLNSLSKRMDIASESRGGTPTRDAC